MTEQDPKRFDYVRLIFRCDDEMFQNDYLPRINSLLIAAQRAADEQAKHNVNVKGRSGRRENYYEIDVWGNQADYFAVSMPEEWWGSLARLDLRHESDALTESVIADLQVKYAFQAQGKHSILSFKTPGATKTDRRDVGGRGIRFGSRKSDQHAVAYKRRGGPGALEYRISGRKAQELGREITQAVKYGGSPSGYEAAFVRMNLLSSVFLSEAAGASSLYGLVLDAKQHNYTASAREIAEIVHDDAAAEEWWGKLSAAEQGEWQQLTFGPTPRGQKD